MAAENMRRHKQVFDPLCDRVVLRHRRRRNWILYAPDYVANAGGALALRMFYQGATESEVRARIKLIQDNLQRIFTQAAELSESPLRAANRSVKTLLDKARTRQSHRLTLSDFSTVIPNSDKKRPRQ